MKFSQGKKMPCREKTHILTTARLKPRFLKRKKDGIPMSRKNKFVGDKAKR